ncbi:MAG: tetratricopeptide repeat protein [Terriglobia bacterium]|jgi:tetratricopeptide (TPR) repeat protein
MDATRDGTKPGGERDFAGQVRGARALPAAVLITATCLAYAATLGFGFVSDDRFQIVGNPFIASWRFLPQYFASHVWSYIYPHLLSNYYRPCFLLWLRLNEAVFGGRAWGWHLTSVAVHVAVTYLVFRLGLRLTRDTGAALAGALLFGLHPVHVEAVAYVSGVAEPLAALFLVAAFLAWLRSREPGPKLRWLAAALALYAGALLSKESSLMLTVLVVVFAWIYVPREGGETLSVGRPRAALVAATPFLAVTAAYLPLRIWALEGFAHTITPLALSAELLTIPSVLLFYLRLLLWPFNLSCYYDTPYVSAPAFRDFVLPLTVILLALAALIFWYRWTRRQSREESRALAFAGLWMALAIAPVLNFRLLPEGEIAHDRYLYLPSVGFVILVALALRQVERRLARSTPGRSAWVAAAAVVFAALLAFATVRQSLYWSDELSLNFRAHQIAPQNVWATTSLAAAAAARGMVPAAVSLYQQALQSRPDFWRANVNLAYLYYQQGNFPEAVRYFERSSAADPTDGDQFLYLGLALAQTDRLEEAAAAIRTALLVRPQGKGYHLGLGLVLKRAGNLPEARQEFAAAVARDPQDAQARALLAEVEGQLKSQAAKPTANSSSPRPR